MPLEEFEDQWGRIERRLISLRGKRPPYQSLIAPGARSGEAAGSVGLVVYNRWLEDQLRRGRKFRVVKAEFLHDHVCFLKIDGDETHVHFPAPAGACCDLLVELKDEFLRQGLIVVRDAEERLLKDESRPVKIRMLRNYRSAPDGLHVQEFESGKEYEIPAALARGFIAQGAAERVKPVKEGKQEEKNG